MSHFIPPSRFLRRPVFLAVWLGASLMTFHLVDAQVPGDAPNQRDPSANGQDAFLTHVYQVADLLDAPKMLQEVSATSSPQIRSGGSRSGGFGGGGGGGFGGGGGGVFRLPDNAILGQGLGMGMGGGMGAYAVPSRMSRETLERILLSHLESESVQWYDVDGTGGSFSMVGSRVIVTHTAEVHGKIKRLLTALRTGVQTQSTIQVDLRIIEVPPGEKTVSDLTKSSKSLAMLADLPTATQLSLRCDNHQVASVSSGLQRRYIVSLTPVVGNNVGQGDSGGLDRSIGYQPVTESQLLGIFGSVKPEIEAGQKRGRVHVGFKLASGPDEIIAAEFGNGLSVDRMEVETASLETSVAGDAGIWTLAGTVAVCDPTSGITSGAALPHLVVLVRWDLAQ